MSESLRDQLLKSGLARAFKSETPARPAAPQRPANGSGRAQKSGPNRRGQNAPAQKRGDRSEIDLAKAYAIRDTTERAERDRAQRDAEQRAREKKERKQKLATLLNGKALNAANAEIPRHFPHANKIRRIYVTAEQLPQLNGGELGVVQFGGRYLLVARDVAGAARDIDAEALVLLCDEQAGVADDGVPSDLVW